MSCQKNSTIFGRTVGLRTGLSQAGSRAGHILAAMARQAGQVTGVASDKVSRTADAASKAVGSRAAPVSNQVLKTINRPTTIAANLAPALVAAACVTQARIYTTGPGQGARPGLAVALGLRDFKEAAGNIRTMGKAARTYRQAQIVGGLAAGVAAAAAVKPGSEEKTLTPVKKQGRPVEVQFSQSRLTGLLNRGDRLLSGRNVISSEGRLIRTGRGNLWHQGTTVIKTDQREQTITHLRSLTLPPTSHYFNRTLSEAETADLVTGQAKAHKTPGYVGSIGQMEQLAPAWAQTKRAMILTRLHWPNPTPEPEVRWQEKEGGVGA